jgi:tRNA(Ile)-lysidine synthase
MRVVKLAKGKYILAVSGGVDSMVLLDLLRQQTGVELVVAHVNHGMRADAHKDEELVRSVCMSHNIMYVATQLTLGAGASEETARNARYNFLQHCRIKFKANAIITAHHQDDLLETVIINLLRGTGWRGLAPFNQPNIVRPLVEIPKSQLVEYAKAHGLQWHEDSTNTDQTYLRNYVRHSLVPQMQRMDSTWGLNFLRHIRNQQQLRRKIEQKVTTLLQTMAITEAHAITLPRHELIMLPSALAYELLQAVSRSLWQQTLLRSQAEALLVFAKVAKPAKTMPLNNDWRVRVTKSQLIVEQRPNMVS